MVLYCKNGCGVEIMDSGGTSTGKDGTVYKIWSEVVNGQPKKGANGLPINHLWECPKRKPSPAMQQRQLNQKHEQVQSGTYAPTYRAIGTSSAGNTLKFNTGTGEKTQREEIKEMADEKNRIAKLDIQAQLEVAKALHDLAAAIRYSADKGKEPELDGDRYKDVEEEIEADANADSDSDGQNAGVR